jgi:hypothetical protein
MTFVIHPATAGPESGGMLFLSRIDDVVPAPRVRAQVRRRRHQQQVLRRLRAQPVEVERHQPKQIRQQSTDTKQPHVKASFSNSF